MSEWREPLERMLQRINETARADPSEGFPHFADTATGRWTRSPTGDWTGGFWNGLLWLAALFTGDDRYRQLANHWTEALRPRIRSETIFRGFLFWYGAAHGARLHGAPAAREVALAGARGLASQYNPRARLIPLGTEAEEAEHVGSSETNIDGVPGGTPLLLWGANELREPELATIALNHAERHAELCVRDDGSVVQSVTFDPETGAMARRYTHKGVRDDSTWTRAQAWAMLGYAQASQQHSSRFGGTLRRVCDWWVHHLPTSGVAFWDFDAAAPPVDTSGTAIGAASLLKAAAILPEREAAYRQAATKSVDALTEQHLTPTGILADGCYNNRIGLATNNELIWGDYFMFEALCVLEGAVDPTLL